MEKYAFKMQLKPGSAAEYKRFHDEIWPELASLLKQAGISDYSIHRDPETEILFGVLWRTDDHHMDSLADSSVMRRWWDEMAAFLVSGPDNVPETVVLEPMFHLR